jgi:hypothetical protein
MKTSMKPEHEAWSHAMRASTPLVLSLLLLCLSGCATRQSFMPAENATDVTRRGYIAAHYESRRGDGGSTEVKVWSGGTFAGETESGEEAPLAHAGFVIDNDSSQPVRLEQSSLKLEGVRVAGGERVGPLSPVEISGNLDVAPNGKSEVEALFRLPDGVTATEVRDFQLSWVLTSGSERYAQRTPFERSIPQPLAPVNYAGPYPYYYWPYYPYYYPYVGSRVFLYRSPYYFYGPPRYQYRRYVGPRSR